MKINLNPTKNWVGVGLMGAIAFTMNMVSVNFFEASAIAQDAAPARLDVVYPEVDPFLGEKLQEGEIESATQIAEIIGATLLSRYPPGHVKRDAHTKSHGCVKAEFSVEKNLEADLAKGVFIPGKTYPAWIRYSNGKANPARADIKGDGRGMAIKLLGIEGETLLERDKMAGTQDFVMMSTPVFFVDDPEDYLSLMKLFTSDSKIKQKLKPLLTAFSIGIKSTKLAAQMTGKKIEHPLKTRYWSTVPYQLGVGSSRIAIKFSARPCMPHTEVIPEEPDDNFLRHAMQETLSAGSACMEFLVQPRTRSSMSVEDSRTEWLEEEAPFYKVATITIPEQTFDTLEQNEFCENLSFTPWHALPEHRPLGSVNRLRKVIYAHISRTRREANSVSTQEP